MTDSYSIIPNGDGVAVFGKTLVERMFIIINTYPMYKCSSVQNDKNGYNDEHVSLALIRGGKRREGQNM